MAADFNLSFRNTMIAEGGYANNPQDPGGETYMGISRKNFPQWPGWLIIDNAKKVGLKGILLNGVLKDDHSLEQLVRSFYRETFWHPLFDQLDQDITNELFDTGVNQGAGTAVKHLQSALNILNRNEQDYKNITVDGGFGPMTLSCYHALMATAKLPSRSYNKIVKALLKWMNYFQMHRYAEIVERAEDQEKWIFGWTERVI